MPPCTCTLLSWRFGDDDDPEVRQQLDSLAPFAELFVEEDEQGSKGASLAWATLRLAWISPTLG